MLTYFFGCCFGSFFPTVIWLANVRRCGLCFHPCPVEISLGNHRPRRLPARRIRRGEGRNGGGTQFQTAHWRWSRRLWGVWDDSEPWFNNDTFQKGWRDLVLMFHFIRFFYSKKYWVGWIISRHTSETQTHALSFASFFGVKLSKRNIFVAESIIHHLLVAGVLLLYVKGVVWCFGKYDYLLSCCKLWSTDLYLFNECVLQLLPRETRLAQRPEKKRRRSRRRSVNPVWLFTPKKQIDVKNMTDSCKFRLCTWPYSILRFDPVSKINCDGCSKQISFLIKVEDCSVLGKWLPPGYQQDVISSQN